MLEDIEQNDAKRYILSQELSDVLVAQEITGKPLLVRGEPGTGKTLLAEYLAYSKKMPIFRWHVKSTTQAKDGLYFYDALSRLNDSRFQDERSEKVKDIENYIRPGSLGEAFESTDRPVILIDEIDKADIEFPNDLLLELDRMEFTISETGRRVCAKTRPLVIITSNNEKELPDAFMRRCLFFYITFPDKKQMKEIVESHYPGIDKSLLKGALDCFYQLRDGFDFRKKPSTSELIDWIQILLHQGASLSASDLKGSLPFTGALLKNEEDLGLFQRGRSSTSRRG